MKLISSHETFVTSSCYVMSAYLMPIKLKQNNSNKTPIESDLRLA
jgi:hypothetical protein